MNATDTPSTADRKPDFVKGLEAAFGPPSEAAFDSPAVSELVVYNIGDGEAMSGLIVAGRRSATGEAAFVTFLMD